MNWNEAIPYTSYGYRWASQPCSSFVYRKIKYYVNTSTFTPHVTQHRTRPATLWDHPTSIAKRSRIKSVPGIASYYCYPIGAFTYDQTTLFQPYTKSKLVGWDQAAYSQMMLARIGGEGTEFGSSIAEIDECAETIRDILATFVQMRHCMRFPPGPKCAKNLRKWFNKHAKARGWKRVEEISGDILANNFGIQPLASQLHSLIERVSTRPVGFTVKKYRMSQHDQTTYLSDNQQWQVSETYHGTSHVYVEFKTPYSQFVDYGNPLEWAWERIPFSFVLDWIVPVGSYIAAFDTLQNVERVVGTVSHKRTMSQYQVGTVNYPFVLERAGWYSSRTYERTLVSPIIMPSLFRLSGNSSVSSLTNALALLVQMRRQ